MEALVSVAKLYRAEALALLESLADGSVACVLTDPPYSSGGFTEAGKAGATTGGIGVRSNDAKIVGDNMSALGYGRLMRLMAVESWRVLAPGGWLLVFCDWRMVSHLQPALESGGLRTRSIVVWAKPTPGLGVGFRSQTEMIIAMAKGKPNTYSSKHGNVLRSKRTGNTHHPTEKPLGLLGKLLEVTTKPGDLVVDPFMGSGSTGVAACGMRRDFVGGDIDPAFLETAHRRLAGVAEVSAPQSAARPQPHLFSSLGPG